MKALIKTHRVSGNNGMWTPYTAGQNVSVSTIELTDYLACRIAGSPAQIEAVLIDPDIHQLDDTTFVSEVRTKHPDFELESCDVADPEIDAIATSLSIDAKARADMQIATRGKHVLQDQENHLMAMISAKKGISLSNWDAHAVASGKWLKGKSIENDIKDGKVEAHEFVLSKIR